MEASVNQPERPARPIRGPHGGWQQQEIEALEQDITRAAETGESLRTVFERMGRQLGRKPNSIRNFYYAQVRAQKEDGDVSLPFETFSQEEVEQLIENVLTARAQGMSVRACVRRLADGDQTRMLRYQNKYRSTVRTRPELVQAIMQRLSEQGIPYVSPYAGEEDAQASFAAVRQKAENTGDPQLLRLMDALSSLIDKAYGPNTEAVSTNENDAQLQADRLSARCDLLRIALGDEQQRRQMLTIQTEGMVSLLKEYIALPEPQRLSTCNAFCREAAARLSAVECAMENPQE